jgi:hypothetical protein
MEGDVKQTRFFWVVALAWVPWVPMIIGLRNTFVGIGNSKATGVGAIAGGLLESYADAGLAAILICEVGAMALLFRAFSRGRGLRSAFSVFSICVSGLMLVLLCLSLWLFWFVRHQGY